MIDDRQVVDNAHVQVDDVFASLLSEAILQLGVITLAEQFGVTPGMIISWGAGLGVPGIELKNVMQPWLCSRLRV